MPIPSGTKFHGVAPGVETENKGSAQANALRDAYTIDELCQSCTESITKLEPEILTVQSGGTTNLTTNKNIVNIDWINGPGTHNVILPSAAAIPYRFLRIVNNGTVDANNKVDIYAPGTETIDGDPFYRINKIYNGIAVWSDGSNWIVIQAKST